MSTIPFDTYLDAGETVQLDATQAIRIQAIGTDSVGAGRLVIGGQETGDINQQNAPLHTESANEQGPLELGDLYYYVPPDRIVTWEGDAGSVVRLIGEREDGVRESFPRGGDQQRFDQQGDRYWSFVTGSYNHGADNTWNDGEEHTVFQLQPESDETYDLARIAQTTVENVSGGLAEDQFAVYWEIDGQDFPSQFNDDSLLGIDVTSAPRPPSDTTEERWLDDLNFTIQGDETLRLIFRNVSGGGITPTAGNALIGRFDAVTRFERRSGR